MKIWPSRKISAFITRRLMKEIDQPEFPACDFDRIRIEVRPCDVLLMEGHSRIAEIIKTVTKSNWSHAALYIGRLIDINKPELKNKIRKHYKGDERIPLIIEGLLGKGIIVTPLKCYKREHIRICRPDGISLKDTESVIAYTVSELGKPYDVRHIFDLLRFLFPFLLLPRHLFSSIFRPRARENKKQICSSLLAEAFASVHFPILPKIIQNKNGKIEFVQRNPKLFTPKDFDYSPYFQIIKYPLFGLDSSAAYRHLPWNAASLSHDDHGIKPVKRRK
jgi:hypothetical protein